MSFLRRAATVGGWTLASRLLGLWRDRLLAGAFGSGGAIAAFLVAFQLPNLLRNLFGEGALSAAFIPRFVQLAAQDRAAADAYAGRVIARLALGLGVVAGLSMAVAAVVAQLAGERTALIAALALPQLPYLVCICTAAVQAGVLNGRRHVAVPAASPVLLNVGFIVAVLVWPEVAVLPWVVLGTGLLQSALHLAALARTGGIPPPRLDADDRIRELRRALAPTLLAAGAFQANTLLDSLLAYYLVGDTAVSYLYYGNRLLQLPLALVAFGIGTAVYPELAEAAGREREGPWRESGTLVRRAGTAQLALLLPAAVGLAVVAWPLAACVYQTGAFAAEDAYRTGLVTLCLALSLVPAAASKLFLRSLHAHRDQRLAARISVAGVGLNLVLNLCLVWTPLREAGLALASSLSAVAICIALAVVLRRRGSGPLLPWTDWPIPALGSALMGAAVLAVLYWWPAPTDARFAQRALHLGTAIAVGVAVYATIGGPVWLRRRRAERRGG